MTDWVRLNIKPEDNDLIDTISEETGLKKYAVIRNALKAAYPEFQELHKIR
jgi:hypothetical protein